jgi:hypothetical protein
LVRALGSELELAQAASSTVLVRVLRSPVPVQKLEVPLSLQLVEQLVLRQVKLILHLAESSALHLAESSALHLADLLVRTQMVKWDLHLVD